MLRFPENRTMPRFPTKPTMLGYLNYNKQAIQAEYSGFLKSAFESFPEDFEKHRLSDCCEKIQTVKSNIEFSSEFFSGNISRMKSFHGHILIFKENLWVSKYKEKKISGNPAKGSNSTPESLLVLTQGASLHSLFKSLPIRSRTMKKVQEYQLRVNLDVEGQYFYSLGYALHYAKDLVGILYHEVDKSVSNKLQSFINKKCSLFPYANRDLCSGPPCNKQQSKIVRCLKNSVEFIQGPPGTGVCNL